MATVSILAGTVLRTDYRSGVARASGNPYEMTLVHVLVANMGVTEVALPSDLSIIGGESPRQGDTVAWVIETTAGQRGINTRIIASAHDVIADLSKSSAKAAA